MDNILAQNLANNRANANVYGLHQKSLAITQAGQSGAGMNEVRKAAEEFEGVFIGQMIRHMYKDIEVNDVFGGGYAEETFRELLLDEYGNAIAKSGGIGVADAVQRELLAAQAAAR